MTSAGNMLIGLAVLALILNRQLRKRAVREDQPYRLLLVLTVVGLVETAQFARHHTVGTLGWVLLAVSLLVGGAFGLLRGLTVDVWRQAGTLFRQGNVLTLVLWLTGLGIHLGLDLLLRRVDVDAQGLAGSAILLYLGFTLGAQQLVVLQRARELEGTVDPGTRLTLESDDIC